MRGRWRRHRAGSDASPLPAVLWWDGDPATADEAIDAARAAYGSAPRLDPVWFAAGELLQQRLINRAHRRATWADVDEAIAVLRELTAAGSPTPDLLDAMGNALATRYEWSGRLVDLDDSLRHLRHAVNRTALDHPQWPGRMANLSMTLRLRHRHTREPGDLSSALAAAQAAVGGLPPNSPHTAILHSNLSILHLSRHEDSAADADLATSIEHARIAVGAPGEPDDRRAIQLSNLGLALSLRWAAAHDPGDLAEAADAARRAVARTPAGHPALGRHLALLGNVLLDQHRHHRDDAALEEAIATRRRLADLPTARPATRITAAVTLAALTGDADAALAGWRTAVELLPLTAWHGLDLTTREQALQDVRDVAREACSAAVNLGRPEAAVELLERGRCVLWGQSLRLRADLSRLAEVAPEQAGRLQVASAGLDNEGTDGEERIRLGRVWDDTLAEIRALPGYADFLAPMPFARLREAAANGPVVVVNESSQGAHALIVTDRVTVVPLHLDNLIERTNTYLEAMSYAAQAVGPGGYLTRERFRHALTDTLAWLWEAVALPVLAALEITGPPTDGQPWPRLWWCPTGALTFLPLHAAGVPGDYLPDRVIPSYVTSLTDLTRARLPRPTCPPRMLAVGADHLPGQPPLPEVGRELDSLRQLLPPDQLTIHTGAHVTRAAVRAAMHEHSWLHLAGHTRPQPEQPTRTGVLLPDGPLTVLDLVDLRPEHAELAYLSACITMLGSGSLTDEALHLPAVLQLAGYRHVIATQWHIQDHHAADVATAVYRQLIAGGRPDAEHAATALHHTLTELRRTGHPVDWAPFIHTGP
ncbi:CHAT domain-containing protein [Actinoplanes sp. NPDC051859]|uniref:CHAT domain-containing protein n=1 Tax=Actinoplanes sp. NPDC051859 TaxID=3363909 RepID=UPI0037B1E201